MRKTNVRTGRRQSLNEKAFTLIELLAVIVVLAIISIIAIPIILNIIDDSKREAKIISAENYLSAVEQVVANKNLEGKYNPRTCEMTGNSGTCTGEFDAVHCNNDNEETACTTADLEVKIDGEELIEAMIKFDNGIVATKTILAIGNLSLVKTDDKLKELSEGPEHLSWKNVRATTPSTKTIGSVPEQDENGNIIVGSEFKIKVNDNSGWLTFFALSNDGDYVNLLAEQNITPDGKFTSEPQNGDEWHVTESNKSDNRYGPQKIYTYLSKATENWVNIPIIRNFSYIDEGNQKNPDYGYKGIETELDNSTGKYITTITPYSSDFGSVVTYENMRARIPMNSEVGSKLGTSPLWQVNYLSETPYYTSVQKVNSKGENNGYWLLSSLAGYNGGSAYGKHCHGSFTTVSTAYLYFGIRPVIAVLKSDLLRVME